MWKQLRSAAVVTGILVLLTGVIYPGVVTALAQLLFPTQANGSLVMDGETVIGSELIGQQFTQAWYFHGRPSAAGAGYDGAASGGRNKGPTDRKLADTLIADAIDSVTNRDGVVRGEIPADMVTASASGLDPHISPANALNQINRVARARGVEPSRVRSLLLSVVEPRQFAVLGEPRVNVLKLNLILDQEIPLK